MFTNHGAMPASERGFLSPGFPEMLPWYLRLPIRGSRGSISMCKENLEKFLGPVRVIEEEAERL